MDAGRDFGRIAAQARANRIQELATKNAEKHLQEEIKKKAEDCQAAAPTTKDEVNKDERSPKWSCCCWF
ncbi:Rossmann-like alpha/beta/alpha sandwich fold-containing protein [Dioscorea alata]|uniref:Rossmann-like alpha/beta/alpha sandwich fold-containing protein n=1 Tax=Dioscorea alata TaxID=55571 RepID=A0ACB7VPF5_DIOAL|nr:Rossmann-like alpha/beta/alpha sandwich fold-containing protein [Dioscorea alata]